MKKVLPVIIALLLLVFAILYIADNSSEESVIHFLDGDVKELTIEGETPILKRESDSDLIIYIDGTAYYDDILDDLTTEEMNKLTDFIANIDDYRCNCKTPNNYSISIYKDGEYQLLDDVEQYKMDELNLLIEDIIK